MADLVPATGEDVKPDTDRFDHGGLVESMIYAERAGMEVSKVIDLIEKVRPVAGRSINWDPNSRGDWKPGFYIKHFLKDMRIAIEDSERMGLELEGLTLAKKLCSMTEAYDFERTEHRR